MNNKHSKRQFNLSLFLKNENSLNLIYGAQFMYFCHKVAWPFYIYAFICSLYCFVYIGFPKKKFDCGAHFIPYLKFHQSLQQLCEESVYSTLEWSNKFYFGSICTRLVDFSWAGISISKSLHFCIQFALENIKLAPVYCMLKISE